MKTTQYSILWIIILSLASISPEVSFAQTISRTVDDFNFGWRFLLGNIENGEQVTLDDSSWRTVDLPHDFQIEQPWVTPDPSESGSNSNPAANNRSRLSERGFKEMGIGWYRKSFVPDRSALGERLLLDFGGIMLVGDIWVNGKHVGGTDYGYVSFTVDITKEIKWGETNVVAVKTNTQSPRNSRWYTGGGLFREVKLISKNPTTSFTQNGIYITTPSINQDEATVAIQTEIEINAPKGLTTMVNVTLINPQGVKVAEQETKIALVRDQKIREYKLPEIKVSNPQLWSCETPNLYTAEITLTTIDGKNSYTDCATETFGIRTIEFSPDFGFKLNGNKVLLKGIANHHELGALGAAAYDRAIEKRFQLLKSFGVNHIRCSHNPYSKGFYQLADKYGILVIDELFDKWNKNYTGNRIAWMELWPKAVPAFVKNTRNHPSVIMWSLGNELQMWWDNEYSDWGVTPYKLMDVLVKRYDKTRPTTVAMFPRRRNGNSSLPPELALETEIFSSNYLYKEFKQDAVAFPDKIFYQSEASVSDMGPNFFDMDLNSVVGVAYWGAINYLGESKGWPIKGWNRGVFETSLDPRPQAYLMKSMFSDEAVVYIGVLENKKADGIDVWNEVRVGVLPLVASWNYDPDTALKLFTYTNAEEVELLINGKSYGIKKNELDHPEKRNQIEWDNINFSAGEVVAIARTGGKEVARHKIESTGKAVALKMEADNLNWKGDGYDLQHINLYAIDAKGRRVMDAGHLVKYKVTGDARLIAVDSGDLSSEELHVVTQRRLYQGAAMAILRAGKKGGEVTIEVHADGLKSTRLKFKLQ